jgi:hypothetical protein
MGQRLAKEVLRVCAEIPLLDETKVAAIRSFMTMELRNATVEEIDQALAVLNDPAITGSERFFAEQIILASESPAGSAELEIQVMRLGGLAFAGLPGEIFVELGLMVKQASPYAHTMVNTLSNGSVYGYVCTAAAYEQGGYEPRLKVFNRISPGTGEQIVAAAAGLLQRLRDV